MEQPSIRYVANYLRKSRGDDISALDKHKIILTELCNKYDWKFIEYEEIGTGDSIEMRPIFSKLLEDVENGVFDAVCVVDIDRLGRGSQSDQGRINQAFTVSDTYIATPQRIYNLNNDEDEFNVDIRSFISRQEYKQIVKRLSQGKKIGSRQGNWTNGIPPFPYEYERYDNKYNLKGLVVNDEKNKIYRYIIDSLLIEGIPPKQIAIALNNKNIKSPKDGLWHGNTIYRMLIDETHLGKIISNKTKGDGHAKKKASAKDVSYISKDKWVVVNNCHEPVKTQDEHDRILLFLARHVKSPKRTQNEIMPLSGLVKCARCGHTMGVNIRKDRNMVETLKTCWYVDEFGSKCGNSGARLEMIYSFMKKDAVKYLSRLIELEKNADIDDNKLMLENRIYDTENNITNKQKTIDRILEGFENGLYTLEQFKERKIIAESNKQKLQQELEVLKLQVDRYNIINVQDKIEKFKHYIDIIDDDNISNIQKNRIYKSVIDKIKWNRKGDDISIEIKYL